MKYYKVIRLYFNGGEKVIKKGLTLEEAQSHCQDPDFPLDHVLPEEPEPNASVLGSMVMIQFN